MKKLFLLLAACGLMVACGGEQKKDDKAAADQNKQEQNDGEQKNDDKPAADQNMQEQNGGEAAMAESAPEVKAVANLTISQLFDQMYDAIQNDDMARFIELAKVVDSWGDELTPAQEEELEAYAMQNFEKMMVVMEAVEMIDLDEYEGDCDCCDEEVWADDDEVWADDDEVWADDDEDDDWSDEDYEW